MLTEFLKSLNGDGGRSGNLNAQLKPKFSCDVLRRKRFPHGTSFRNNLPLGRDGVPFVKEMKNPLNTYSSNALSLSRYGMYASL